MDRHHEVLSELREPTSSLRHAIPDAWAGFLSRHAGAMVFAAVERRMMLDAARARDH
jgi:hypothetical protein